MVSGRLAAVAVGAAVEGGQWTTGRDMTPATVRAMVLALVPAACSGTEEGQYSD